jgi:pimeloyl-ACP methyl ester carboxylesterase
MSHHDWEERAMIAGSGPERGHASVGKLKIAYESAGTGAPAAMLIHGALGDRTYFAALMTHLARRRRVIALDLRGHGESDAPQELSIEDFEADVIGVAEHAHVDSTVLCGHSIMGAVALAVAAARPELVRGVVMLDSPIFYPEPARQQALGNFLPALETDRWSDALRGFFSRMFDPNDPPEVTARVMASLDQARPETARSFFNSLFGTDFAARERRIAEALEDLHCPLLYVHATAPTDLQRLRELRPAALVGQVVGSGHYLMLSVPEQVNAMLDRFLEMVEAPRE